MALLAPEMRQRARQAYADALLRHHPSSISLAHSIVDGKFANFWLDPAIDVIASLMRAMPDDDQEEGRQGGRG